MDEQPNDEKTDRIVSGTMDCVGNLINNMPPFVSARENLEAITDFFMRPEADNAVSLSRIIDSDTGGQVRLASRMEGFSSAEKAAAFYNTDFTKWRQGFLAVNEEWRKLRIYNGWLSIELIRRPLF